MKPNPFTKQGKALPGEVSEMIDCRKMVRAFETIPNSVPV